MGGEGGGTRLHAQEALPLAVLPHMRHPREDGLGVRMHEVPHALHDARNQGKHKHLHSKQHVTATAHRDRRDHAPTAAREAAAGGPPVGRTSWAGRGRAQ